MSICQGPWRSPCVGFMPELMRNTLLIGKTAGWLGEDDPVLLEGLWEDRRILASYDRATLPGHLAERIAEGQDHAGVIFVDQERFPVSRIGQMARALAKLLAAKPVESDWINRIVTLTT